MSSVGVVILVKIPLDRVILVKVTGSPPPMVTLRLRFSILMLLLV